MRLLVLGSLIALGVVVGAAACDSFSEADTPPASEAGTDSPADGQSLTDAGPGDAAVVKVLADGLGADLTGIDTNATTAYVIKHDVGAILSVDLEDGGAIPLAVSGVQAPSAILAIDDQIIWADFGHHSLTAVSRQGPPMSAVTGEPPDGGPEGPCALAHIPGDEKGFLVATLNPGGSGNVALWGISPLTVRTLIQPVPDLTNPFDVAATATTLYWSESSTASVWKSPMPSAGGAPSLVAAGQNGVESIAAEGSDVYWAVPDAVRTGADNSARDVAPGEKSPFSLAADAASVYWLTPDGTLRRFSRQGDGGTVTLASGFAASFDRRAQAIALTKDYVVWITSDGQVLRRGK